MGMTIKKNQPVVFDKGINTCLLNQKEYSQHIQSGDITQFQIQIDRCDDLDSVVVNGDFEGSGGWTYTGAFAEFTDAFTFETNAGIPTSNIGSAYQDCLAVGGYFKIEIEVVRITEGGINIFFGTNPIGTLTGEGVYELFGFCLTNSVLTISANGNSQFYVDNISAYFVPYNYVIPIYDNYDTFITEIRVDDLITPSDPITDNVTLVDNFLTIFVNWDSLGIANTCVYFCILDPCVNTCGQNGLFDEDFILDTSITTATRWELTQPASGGVTNIVGGLLAISVNTILDSGIAEQAGFCSGNIYDFELDIAAIANGTVTIRIGTAASAGFTTSGVKTGQITANGTLLTITFTRTGGSVADVTIEHLKIRIATNEYTPDNCSNLFALKDEQSCTILINACNEDDAFDFGFSGTGFAPSIRVEGKLINPFYEYTRELKEDTSGKKTVHFFNRRKIEKLSINYQPAFIHDFLSLLAGYDHVYIDSVEYIIESEGYEPEYLEDEDNMAQIIIDVSERSQNMRNMNCTGSDTGGCSPPPNFVIDPGDAEAFLLDPDDLEKVVSLEF